MDSIMPQAYFLFWIEFKLLCIWVLLMGVASHLTINFLLVVMIFTFEL